MVCVRFTKKWPITKIQVRDILKIFKGVCVGPSPKKVGGSSNAIKAHGPIELSEGLVPTTLCHFVGRFAALPSHNMIFYGRS